MNELITFFYLVCMLLFIVLPWVVILANVFWEIFFQTPVWEWTDKRQAWALFGGVGGAVFVVMHMVTT